MSSPSQLQQLEQLMEANAHSDSLAEIRKFIFQVGHGPDVLNTSYFKERIRGIANEVQVAIPTYKSLLLEELKETQSRERELKQEWEKSGCSVILDSWGSQCGKKSFISVLVHCRKGMLFLRSKDVSAIIEDVDMLEEMISCVVDEVGANNIVQVVINDASPYMQNARHRVLKEHGHSFFFPLCADFCINFLLGKIAALGHISEVLTKAKEITRFINGNEMPVKLVGNGEIVSNSCLKYVAAFLTLEKLVSERANLVEMFNSPEWASSDWDASSTFRYICDIVKTDAFWCAAADVLKVTIPFVKVLFKLEREDCPMGILYEAMDCAKEEMMRHVGDKHGDILSWVDKIWDIYLHSPLHAAGYMLNPRVFYKDHACDDPEVISGIEACITQMANGNYDPKKVKAQTEVYRRKLGSLGSDSSAIKEMMELPQVCWWSVHGTDTPELQTLATRILSQTCFGAKRYNINWHVSEKVHEAKAFDNQDLYRGLEYVHYNMRLPGAKPLIGGLSGDQVGKPASPLDDWIWGPRHRH
ncbi:uncharacterized protein LOC124684164 [Lolium rigidum]|uniref:uncharacterized protein LOC124684164 n=1 Tax=Lolium rigidum TaxID=89674 RepID=UPI001F5D2F50|nr:uncharacterized protein LOC124684164 [Lolium rigidum]XP_047074503.1 uncharacterized protein LOC124684164 [Lolium rigidum]